MIFINNLCMTIYSNFCDSFRCCYWWSEEKAEQSVSVMKVLGLSTEKTLLLSIEFKLFSNIKTNDF